MTPQFNLNTEHHNVKLKDDFMKSATQLKKEMLFSKRQFRSNTPSIRDNFESYNNTSLPRIMNEQSSLKAGAMSILQDSKMDTSLMEERPTNKFAVS